MDGRSHVVSILLQRTCTHDSQLLQEGNGLGKNSEGLLQPVDPVIPCEGHAGIGVVCKQNLMTVEEKASKELDAVLSRNSFVEHCYNQLWKEKCFSRVDCLELPVLVPDVPTKIPKASKSASKVLQKDSRFQFCTNQRGIACIYLASTQYAGFERNHDSVVTHGCDDRSAFISFQGRAFEVGTPADSVPVIHSNTVSASKPAHRWIDDRGIEPQEMWPALQPPRLSSSTPQTNIPTRPDTTAAELHSCYGHAEPSADTNRSSLDTKFVTTQALARENGSITHHQQVAFQIHKPPASAKRSAFAPPNFSYHFDDSSSLSSNFQLEDSIVVMQSSKRESEAINGSKSDESFQPAADVSRARAGSIPYRPPQARGASTPPGHLFEVEQPRNRSGLGLYRPPQARGDVSVFCNLDAAQLRCAAVKVSGVEEANF
jgi:hypothetical protein